jgi:hypothetical protein
MKSFETEYCGKKIQGLSIEKYENLLGKECLFTDSATMIINNLKNINTNEQMNISKFIVNNGCRYAVCYGNKCESWDDSIDYAYLERKDYKLNNDQDLVMTTWHEKERIEEVLFYFFNLTVIDNWFPQKYVLLDISNDEGRLDEFLEVIKQEEKAEGEKRF